MVNKQEFLDTYNYFDKEILTEIIDIFLSEYPGRFEKLYKDIELRNYNDLRFDAHGLKGVVATFCAPEAKQLAYELEKAGSLFMQNNGEGFNESEVTGKIDMLRDCVHTMAQELQEIKDSL
ncbi:MAG: Hpt domain-containing protein [Chloroflexota bacterium]|nr:Hpt domain-containing protein [Lentimicrobium sp.]